MEKRNLQFSDSVKCLKRDEERSYKYYHFRKTLNYTKNFRKNNTDALVISKRLEFQYDDRTDKNIVAPLRMQKVFSKYFLRKLSLGTSKQ